MKARRFSRITSRPFHSATPRRHVASSTKQSKPLPKVLSSISFQKANSHSGGAVFLMVRVVISFSSCVRVVILLLLNIRRLAPPTPNMGWVGPGRKYSHYCSHV